MSEQKAKQAVEEWSHSYVTHCTATLMRCGCEECWARDPEAVADRLLACFRDQALSGQGWDALQQEMLSAQRYIADAVDLWWRNGRDDDQAIERAARQYLLAAATHLLNICSMVEAMRRAER